ncbi:MAG: hypothetical protein K5756_02025 [Clostridiales bacterium]|nr:hypothetical protein [Clostridiales bacterium]
MKKLKLVGVVSAVLCVIFIIVGLIIKFVAKDKKVNETPKVTQQVTEVETVYDIYSPNGVDELKKVAGDTDVSIESSEEEKNILRAEGYEFASVPLSLTIEQNDAGDLLSIEGTGVLFDYDHKPDVAQYKEKLLKVINEFAKRFNIPADKYEIFEQKEDVFESLDINSDASYQRIIDGKAKLTYYVKDENGHFWMLRAKNELVYGTLVVEIVKLTDPAVTKDMFCNVDLSQTKTEGQK